MSSSCSKCKVSRRRMCPSTTSALQLLSGAARSCSSLALLLVRISVYPKYYVLLTYFTERDEWIAQIESATVIGKKKKPTRTLIDGDKITAICAPSTDVIWSASSQLQLNIRDARTGETRAQRKLELQLSQANLPTVCCMLRPRNSPHVWVAVANFVFRLSADSGASVDQLTVLPANAVITAMVRCLILFFCKYLILT